MNEIPIKQLRFVSTAVLSLVGVLGLIATSENGAKVSDDSAHITWSNAHSSQNLIGLGLVLEHSEITPWEDIQALNKIPAGCIPLQTPDELALQATKNERSRATRTVHHTLTFQCGGLPLLAYQWDLAYQDIAQPSDTSQNADSPPHTWKLTMVSGSMASGLGKGIRANSQDDADFGADPAHLEVVQSRRGWWAKKSPILGGIIRVAAVEETVTNHQTGQLILRFRKEGGDEIFESHVVGFDALSADVYGTNQNDKSLIHITLPTSSSTFLDSKFISTYGGTTSAKRAKAGAGSFDLSPERESDRDLFDQVQANYAAQKAADWFATELHHEWEGLPLEVFTHYTVHQSSNNARYRPAFSTNAAALLIGNGDGDPFVNLARDTDVIFHEFSHHIIYRTVKGAAGDPSIIHEGTADYFAYAINGDPYLAESIHPGKPWIRTAALDRGKRFDDPRNDRDPHELGQYWSAVLWQLRGEVGKGIDQVVYDALAYLPPGATFADFFVALIHADGALHPEASLDRNTNGGTHYCAILRAGLEWGFAKSLKKIDGSGCGLDLVKESAESERWRKEQLQVADAPVTPEEESKSSFKVCGVAGGAVSAAGSLWWFLLPLILIPSISTIGSVRRRKH